jgi:hypothetical protein
MRFYVFLAAIYCVSLTSKNNKIIIALLVVAVVVVAFIFVGVPALFYSGAFNAGPMLRSTTCIAMAGYVCENATYSAATGYLEVNIGLSPGIAVSQVSLVAAGYNSTSSATPAQLFNTSNAVPIPGGLSSGQVVMVGIPINKNLTSGVIWMQYTYAGSTSTNYADVASFMISAGK